METEVVISILEKICHHKDENGIYCFDISEDEIPYEGGIMFYSVGLE